MARLSTILLRLRWQTIGVFVLATTTYFLARTPALDEWDSVQFAQGVGDFNLWRHHPHPPGYPLYIFAGWLLHHGLHLDVPTALQLASALGGGLFVAAWFALAARSFGRPVAWGLAAALGTLLITWMTATKALTDAPGAGLLALALLLARERRWHWAAVAGALAVGVRPQMFPVVLLVICLGGAGPVRRRVGLLGTFAAGCALWLVPTVVLQARTPEAHGRLLAYPTQLLGQWRWRLDQPKAFIGAETHGRSFLSYRLDHHVLGLLTRGFGFSIGSGWGWLGIALLVLGWTFYALDRRRQGSGSHAAFWQTHLPWTALYVAIVFCCLPGDQRYYLPIFPLLLLPALWGWSCLAPAGLVVVPAACLAATLPLIESNHIDPAPPVAMIRWLQGQYPPATRARVWLVVRDSFRHAQWYAPEFHVANAAALSATDAPLPGDTVYTDDAAYAATYPSYHVVQTFERSPLIYRKHSLVELYRCQASAR